MCILTLEYTGTPKAFSKTPQERLFSRLTIGRNFPLKGRKMVLEDKIRKARNKHDTNSSTLQSR